MSLPAPGRDPEEHRRGAMALAMARLLAWLPAPARQWISGSSSVAAIQLAGSTAVANALVLLSAPILTRIYSPEEMGLFGVLLAFVGLCMVVVSLRFDMAIVPARSTDEANRLVLLSGIVALPVAGAAAVILAVLIAVQAPSFALLPLSATVAAVMLLLAIAIFTTLRFWAVRAQEFRAIARAQVEQGVGRAILPILGGLAGLGWWGLLVGELAGRIAGVQRLVRISGGAVATLARRTTRAELVDTAKLNWRYPAIVAPSSLVDALGGALPMFLIAAAFGPSAAGQLLIVQRIAGVPAALVGASVADVFHSRAAATFLSAPAELPGLVARTVSKLFLVGLAVYLPLAALSALAFTALFGSEWATAGRLVVAFTPLHIAALATSPVTRLYVVVNRPELKLVFDLLFVAAPVLSLWVLPLYGAGFWQSVTAYVAATTTALLAQFALVRWAASAPPRRRGSDGS
jgi:lipopolysaccharide exporter